MDKTFKSLLFFGLGTFQFFISILPKNFKWILTTVGFKGDRKEGLELLAESLKMQAGRSCYAGSLMLWIKASFYEDYEEANEFYR